MRLHIVHELRYTYSRPVFFEPTLVRLRPRHDHIQRPIEHDMRVEPEPAGSTAILDAHDNGARLLWFDGTHDCLEIKCTTTVEMSPHRPFDYLIHGEQAVNLPVSYPPADAPMLELFRERQEVDAAFDSFIDGLRSQSNDVTQDFLRLLVLAIPNHCEQVHRAEGDPRAAARTFNQRKGSCRDLSVLFIEACRAVGLASRFVSGYCTAGSVGTINELHAWAEVFLPGAGWRGYDPTIGVATEDQHIVLATAADPANAAPTTGSYRGTDIESYFTHHVEVAAVGTER